MNLRPLIPLIGAFVLLAVVVGFYSFEYSLIGTQSSQTAALAKSIAQKTQTSARVSVARSQLASLRTREASIDQYFISTNDVVPFLEQLATTGNYLGSIVTVESVAASPSLPFGQLSLSLQITGPFDSVMRTLGAIEYGPYATKITSLSFDTPPASAGTVQKWTANAVFSIGAQPVSATPTPVVTPIPNPAVIPPAQPTAAPSMQSATTSSLKPTPTAASSSTPSRQPVASSTLLSS